MVKNISLMKYFFVTDGYSEDDIICIIPRIRTVFTDDSEALIAKGNVSKKYEPMLEQCVKLLPKLGMRIELTDCSVNQYKSYNYAVYIKIDGEKVFLRPSDSNSRNIICISDPESFFSLCNYCIMTMMQISLNQKYFLLTSLIEGAVIPLPTVLEYDSYEYERCKDCVYRINPHLSIFMTQKDRHIHNRLRRRFRTLSGGKDPDSKTYRLSQLERDFDLIIHDIEDSVEYDENNEPEKIHLRIKVNGEQMYYIYCPKKRTGYSLKGTVSEISVIVWLRVWAKLNDYMLSKGYIYTRTSMRLFDGRFGNPFSQYVTTLNGYDFVKFIFNRPFGVQSKVLLSVPELSRKKWIRGRYSSGLYGSVQKKRKNVSS